MKKLMVLAAVAAMALGAKADWTFTFDIPNAQAAFVLGGGGGYNAQGPDHYMEYDWDGAYKLLLFNAEASDAILEEFGFSGLTTWAERYSAINMALVPLEKTDAGKFADVIEYEGYDHPSDFLNEYLVLALFDDDEFSPGGKYALYYGLSSFAGDVNPVDLTALESGTLMTDTSSVPEPTSGLLLLLGVAGLALRRKFNG